MDRIDSFYQEMDSKDLLDRRGPGLAKEAREVLLTAPSHARVGGMILMADAKDGSCSATRWRKRRASRCRRAKWLA